MFSGLARSADLAIDLGTHATRLAARGRGVIAEIPTVVAWHTGPRGRRVGAVGADARKMLGRTPSGMEVVRPVRGGVVADFAATEALLRALLDRSGSLRLLRPRVLVCIAPALGEVERRAVQEATRAAGARDVLLAPSSMAAAIGAELPVRDPVGSMVVDIGAGHTDVAITSLGGFVVARSSSAGGDALDHAIRTWLRDKHDLLVGERTAEGIKHRVGAADRVDPMLRTRIRGRDATTGVPREVDLDSTAIADALAPAVTAIRETVLSALAAAPPEISSDILARGILLCGGTAKLRRIEAHLGDAIGLPVLQADDPGRCVARGAARLLDDPVLFDRIAIAA